MANGTSSSAPGRIAFVSTSADGEMVMAVSDSGWPERWTMRLDRTG